MSVLGRAGTVAALAVALFVAGCGGDSEPTPQVTATTSATAAATVAATAPTLPTVGPPPDTAAIDAAVEELLAASAAAGLVRSALSQASITGAWDPVTEACATYPVTPANPGSSLPVTHGLSTLAQRPDLWPASYIELDNTSATACFLVSAAQSIPPDARIDVDAPTTAEIVAQPLDAARLPVGSPTAEQLRLLLSGAP